MMTSMTSPLFQHDDQSCRGLANEAVHRIRTPPRAKPRPSTRALLGTSVDLSAEVEGEPGTAEPNLLQKQQADVAYGSCGVVHLNRETPTNHSF